LPKDIKEEFLRLKFYRTALDNSHHLTLDKLRLKYVPAYPQTGKQALRILVPFPSIYLCEAEFPALLIINIATDLMLKVTCLVLFLPQSQESQNLGQIC
jgi:hypothetical protein